MDGRDVETLVRTSVLERVAGNARRRLVRDELDRLDDTVDDLSRRIRGGARSACEARPCPSTRISTDLVLDTRVLSLGVLTDDDRVDIVVRSLKTLD